MTTIAIDEHTLAIDGLVTENGTILSYDYTKVLEKDNFLFAVCGSMGTIEHIADWYITGARPAEFPVNTVNCAVVVDREKQSIVSVSSDCPYPYMVYQEGVSYLKSMYAEGSGRELALGAMEAGASAIKAVQIAAKYDNCTGGWVKEYKLWEKP